MTTSNFLASPVLSDLSNWIREIDEHAEHHLTLVVQAQQALDSGELSVEQRQQLASRLERWRYQHFNERGDSLTNQDESLLALLDQFANQLRGGPSRQPRRVHRAIHDPQYDVLRCSDSESSGSAASVLGQWLDPCYPLEALTEPARVLTDQHFSVPADASVRDDTDKGQRRMVLYAPLYVSSQCVNHCTYCGFRFPLAITRTHLENEQVVEQAMILRNRGFRHQLLVAGDYPSRTSAEYLSGLVQAMTDRDLEVSIEIAAQSTDSYQTMVQSGACGLTLYQETYDKSLYREYHVRGPKSSYHWRLEAPDRAAEAGISRIGFGVLLGLADPGGDVTAMLRHATYLKRRFPDLKLSFSLPRIHEAPDGFQIPYLVSDETLIRLYCVLRIAYPDAELVLSTRESAELRRTLSSICITQMSAGSCTVPGGYSDQQPNCECDQQPGEQFPVTDERSASEVAESLRKDGFQVWWSFAGNDQENRFAPHN